MKKILFTLASVALMAIAGCTKAPVEELYIDIAEVEGEFSYDALGGTQKFHMFSNIGQWEICPTYEEDWEWVTVYPRTGSDDAIFSVQIKENASACSRVCDLNIVAGGKVVKTIIFNQAGANPSMSVAYKGTNKVVASAGEQFKIRINSNIGWEVRIPYEDQGWLSVAAQEDDFALLEAVKNEGASDRSTTIQFVVPGTEIRRMLKVTQAGYSASFDVASKSTIADVLAMTGGVASTVSENTYIEGVVVSDVSTRNFAPDRMYVMDESGKGLCIEWDDESSNDYARGTKLTLYLYKLQTVTDQASGEMYFANFTKASVMKVEPEANIDPIELTDVREMANHEHCLVTLKDVEFVLPWGTYFNKNEREVNQPYGTYDITNSLPYSDLNTEYTHLLRDSQGNIGRLYTYYTYIYRGTMAPAGSGDLTGVVTRRTKEYKDVWELRMRDLDDDKVSRDEATRHSKAVMKLGPWYEQKAMNKAVAEFGEGQLLSNAAPETIAANNKAGNVSMYMAPAYARCAPASYDPATDRFLPIYDDNPEIILYCIVAQDWWDNNYNRNEDILGTAWVVKTTTKNIGEGQLSIDLSVTSSSSGPRDFTVEWATDMYAPLSQWQRIGSYMAGNHSTTSGLKIITLDVPDSIKGYETVYIRLRNASTVRAKGTSTPIDAAGTSRLGAFRLSIR